MIHTINTFLSPVENFLKKNRIWLSRILLLLSFLSLSFIWQVNGPKESGEKAILLLWIILWIPILARVFSLRFAQALLPLRKELGILMGTIAFIHGSLYIVPYSEELLTKGFWITDGRISYLAVGFFALLLTIPLTLTSNNWSMKIMGKYWKMLHRLVYVIIILTVIHVVLLKLYLHFEITPVIILILYFIGKILEWKNISFGKNTKETQTKKGQKWICIPCGFIYDPALGDKDSGIPPGTEFVDIPENWSCPLCGVKKSDFTPYNEDDIEATTIGLVKNLTYMNPTTIELVIETEVEHDSTPGQYMSFLLQDANGQFPRSYSIAKQEGKSFTFLIKLAKEGRGAKFLQNLEVGEVLRIRNISGKFILKNTKNPKIFIATGTGLSPIYRMITASNQAKNPPELRLYFTVATKDELFYAKELQSLENLDLHIHISREEVEGYNTGRVDVSQIDAPENTEWYLCGNPKMVEEARAKLLEKGYKNIYSEEF